MLISKRYLNLILSLSRVITVDSTSIEHFYDLMHFSPNHNWNGYHSSLLKDLWGTPFIATMQLPSPKFDTPASSLFHPLPNNTIVQLLEHIGMPCLSFCSLSSAIKLTNQFNYAGFVSPTITPLNIIKLKNNNINKFQQFFSLSLKDQRTQVEDILHFMQAHFANEHNSALYFPVMVKDGRLLFITEGECQMIQCSKEQADLLPPGYANSVIADTIAECLPTNVSIYCNIF